MLKDLFIDNNVAKNFANPLDPEYKKLIQWLMTFDKSDLAACPHLVVSRKLLVEYKRSTGNAYSSTNITIIVAKLTREGRIVLISNQEIKQFKRKHFTKTVERKLTCNMEDRDHIPVVLLSHRKYALSLDKAFVNDINCFPGFKALAARRPQDLPYDQ